MSTAGVVLVSAMFGVWGVGVGSAAIIDIRHKILPTKILRPTGLIAFALVVAAALVEGDPIQILYSFLSAASCWAIFYFIYWFNPKQMGYGDVRLVTVNGVVVGWYGISAAWLSLALAFFLAFPLTVWFLLRHGIRKGMTVESPFGPFLVAAAGLVSLSEAVGLTSLD